MPRAENRILEAYLEDVSGKVLQEYPAFIRESIKGRSGVYVLFNRSGLYYVGLASNLMGRLKQHLQDRHTRKWDRFSVYLTERSDARHIRELEALLLRIVRPKGNRVVGRLKHADNLWTPLSAHMRAEDEHRRAVILGGAAKERLRRRTTTSGKGAKALERVVARATPLRATHKDVEYRGTLYPNGELRVGHQRYPSPSAAGKACVGRSVNGWAFWLVRLDGEWVPLSKLRA